MHFKVIWGYLLFWITGDNQVLIVVNYSHGILNDTSPKVQSESICVLRIYASTFFLLSHAIKLKLVINIANNTLVVFFNIFNLPLLKVFIRTIYHFKF